MIPKIIHCVWIGPPMPEWARRNVQRYRDLNPGWELRIHDESALLPNLRTRYDAIDDPSAKSDLIRYSALAGVGGVYLDTDFMLLRPLEDAIRAYCLDGSRLYLGRQRNDKGHPEEFNGAVLFAGDDCQGIRWLIEQAEQTAWNVRCAYGPRLITRLVRERHDLVEVAETGWWYGPSTTWAAKICRACERGNNGPARMYSVHTNRQLPFGIHEWAKFHGDKLRESTDSGKRALICCTKLSDTDPKLTPLRAIGVGLEKIGIVCEYLPTGHAGCPLESASDLPDIMVVWNGRRDSLARSVQRARDMGIIVLQVEHGFFDRSKYSQVDHKGILHGSSWARNVSEPAPPEGAARLARFYPSGLTPIGKRHGYVLVCGQVPRDTQLMDSEITGWRPLLRQVTAAVNSRAKVVFRPHPLDISSGSTNGRRDAYKMSKHGADLASDLAGAAFAVAINSNALREALALGVPCLAYGPDIGINAQAVKQATPRTIGSSIDAMLSGWTPKQEAVQNYMEWLSARQWTAEELANPEVLAGILKRAQT